MRAHIPDTGKMVPDAWMEAADRVLVPGKPMTTSDLRKALAAVAPLIAAQERERVAKWHDRQTEEATARAEDAKTRGETGNVLHHARFAVAHHISAAAIRAMGNADE